jgi:toxin CptA
MFEGRLEWRPSRWLAGAQAMLGALAALSLPMSALSSPWDAIGSALAVAWGLFSARRILSAPPRLLVWPATGAPRVDGIAIDDARLHWRGPLAFLEWRDASGRRRRLSWWPDTLPPERRRELRLAAGGAPAAARARSVAG